MLSTNKGFTYKLVSLSSPFTAFWEYLGVFPKTKEDIKSYFYPIICKALGIVRYVLLSNFSFPPPFYSLGYVYFHFSNIHTLFPKVVPQYRIFLNLLLPKTNMWCCISPISTSNAYGICNCTIWICIHIISSMQHCVKSGKLLHLFNPCLSLKWG